MSRTQTRQPCLSPLAWVRDAMWLDADRGRAYAAILLGAMLAALLYGLRLAWLADRQAPGGLPIATDFVAFWSVSKLALAGHSALAYDTDAFNATNRAAAWSSGGDFAFYYPPTFILFCLPLSLLPYVPSMIVFFSVLTASFAWLIRAIMQCGRGVLYLCAAPVVLMNMAAGQAGLLTGLPFCLSILFLETRPILAGAALGALACKPTLAICVPVALLAARRWSALIACASTAAFLIGLSWLVFGLRTWVAFMAGLAHVRETLLHVPDHYAKMLSLYGAARLLHAGPGTAFALQAAAALIALATVAVICRTRPGAGSETSVVAAATLFCTPYLFDYDMTLTLPALAWTASRAGSTGWLPWEKLTALLIFLLPMVVRFLNLGTGVPIAPLVFAAFLLTTCRRARLSRGQAA